MPIAMAKSFQFSSCYYVFTAGTIALLLLKDSTRSRLAYLVFLNIGIMTAYVDFLTYPIATFGVAAIIGVALSRDNNLEEKLIEIVRNGILYNGPPVKTTREKIIVNQIIPYQPILSPEPPCYRSAQRNCPAEQGCLDRLGLAGTMALARCPQLLNPLRTLAAAAQPARTRLSRSVACDAKQLW